MVRVCVSWLKDATMICMSLPDLLHKRCKVEEIAVAWSSYVRGNGGPSDFKDLSFNDTTIFPKIDVEPPSPPGWRIWSNEDGAKLMERILWSKFWDKVWKRKQREVEQKVIHVPKPLVDKILEEAEKGGHDDIKLNRSEVFAAWLIKVRHTKALGRQYMIVALTNQPSKRCHQGTEDNRMLDIVIQVSDWYLPEFEKLDTLTQLYLNRTPATVCKYEVKENLIA